MTFAVFLKKQGNDIWILAVLFSRDAKFGQMFDYFGLIPN